MSDYSTKSGGGRCGDGGVGADPDSPNSKRSKGLTYPFLGLVGVVSQIMYCGFKFITDMGSFGQPSKQKALYVHMFPPALGDDLSINPYDESRGDELIFDTHLRRETLINFWSSREYLQANGTEKGGSWGSNNLPTTNPNWFGTSDGAGTSAGVGGIFIGDGVKIQWVHPGIIPYKGGKPFEDVDILKIIPGSESSGFSSNIEYNGRVHSAYLCGKPIPQRAIDVLFVMKRKGKYYLKVLRRGNPNPNLDKPYAFMPGAGEHKEPGLDFIMKAGALRAIGEEIGVPEETLVQCFLLQNIAHFNEYGRDSRYSKYSAIQDSKLIEFGVDRESSTTLSVLFINCTDEEPKEIDPTDTIEIGSKKWVEVGVVSRNPCDWFIPEHASYLDICLGAIVQFEAFTPEEKVMYRAV